MFAETTSADVAKAAGLTKAGIVAIKNFKGESLGAAARAGPAWCVGVAGAWLWWLVPGSGAWCLALVPGAWLWCLVLVAGA